MLERNKHPNGTIVRHDKRRWEYHAFARQGRNWGFAYWLPKHRLRVVWDNGDVSLQRSDDLVVMKEYEKLKKKYK